MHNYQTLTKVSNAYQWESNGYQDSGVSEIGDVARRYLPGIAGVPIGGLLDILDGAGKIIYRIATLDSKLISNGISNVGQGALSAVGLRQVLTEKWVRTDKMTGSIQLAESLARSLAAANTSNIELSGEDGANGMHGWHGATMQLYLVKLVF